jgi:hypothetical protein
MMFIVEEGEVMRVIGEKYLWNKSQLDAVAIMENFIVLNDVKVSVDYFECLLWECSLIFEIKVCCSNF